MCVHKNPQYPTIMSNNTTTTTNTTSAANPTTTPIATFHPQTIFASSYTWTRYNNIRCFPNCGSTHRERQFCGSPILINFTNLISTSQNQNEVTDIYVFGEFQSVGNMKNSNYTASSCVEKYPVNTKCSIKNPLLMVSSSTSTTTTNTKTTINTSSNMNTSNPQFPVNHFPANLIKMKPPPYSVAIFAIYPPRKWQNDAPSITSNHEKEQHNYMFVVYAVNTKTEICVAVIKSNPFRLIRQPQQSKQQQQQQQQERDDLELPVATSTNNSNSNSVSNTISSSSSSNDGNKLPQSKRIRNYESEPNHQFITAAAGHQQQQLSSPFFHPTSPPLLIAPPLWTIMTTSTPSISYVIPGNINTHTQFPFLNLPMNNMVHSFHNSGYLQSMNAVMSNSNNNSNNNSSSTTTTTTTNSHDQQIGLGKN
jgi:hypothetical protein